MIHKLNRLIVFDPKREWATYSQKWLGRCRVIYSIDTLKKQLIKCWEQGFKFVYVPEFGRESADLSEICCYLYMIQAEFGITHSAKITILIDEAQEGIPTGTARDNPRHGALILARMGRSRGVNMIVCSQRLTTIDINIRANLSRVYIYRLAELSDIKAANEIIHNKDGLLKQANFSYFLRDENGLIKFYKK